MAVDKTYVSQQLHSVYGDWKGWDSRSFGAFSATEAAYFSSELQGVGLPNCSGLKVFELGFGNGAFAGYVRSSGGEYFGSEVNQLLVERARESGFTIFSSGLVEAIERGFVEYFDIVVAFDVLEHLSIAEIGKFFTEARQILKSGGMILAKVPSGDSPFGRAIFHGDITHCTVLGSQAVSQLAKLYEFDVINIGAPKLPLIGLGVRKFLRRSAILFAQKAIGKIINIIFHEGRCCIITSNLVFSLKKKR